MTQSPYIRKSTSVQRVMGLVLIALLPGIAAYVIKVGAGILVNLLIATCTALAAEALVLAMRKRPLGIALGDLSAVVTAWLVALCFPPIAPWWLTVGAVILAIIVAKHLYGGLGQNPFNPAMVAYSTMIISFPALMSQWPPAGELSFATQLDLILGGSRDIDGITGATALDALRTSLHTGASAAETISQDPAFGFLGGRGWEWVSVGHLVGGLFLLATRVISWHMPVAFIASLSLIAGVFWLFDPGHFASPLFHLASGGAILAAFFIITDPVTGATTPRGKLIFAAGVALIAWIVRSFGAYPEGIAFGVLLMNICVPFIDMKTQPAVFGHRQSGDGGHQ